jgi:hypothetical protein
MSESPVRRTPEVDETVRFGIDGQAYEIDLSGQDAKALRNTLAPYISAARRVSRTRRPPAPRQSSTAPPSLAKIRG